MWEFIRTYCFQIAVIFNFLLCIGILQTTVISDLSKIQMPIFGSAVCSFTYSKKDKINASSLIYEKAGYAECEYIIKAPRNNFIVLNFTDLIGFHWYPGSAGGSATTDLNKEATNIGGSYKTESTGIPFVKDNCLPPELIIQETLSGKEITTIKKRICNLKSYTIPQVFHSKANLLKIIYIWIPEEHSGFLLNFDFHKKNSNCVFYCDDTKCLSDSLVCNEEYNCRDKTDESNCSSTPSHVASPYIIKIVVIIVIVVLMPVLAALVCVASPLRLTSRMWRRWRTRDRSSVERRQLRPRSQDSEVVYMGVPTAPSTTLATHDHTEQHDITQLSRVEKNLLTTKPAQAQMFNIDLPPQIPISRDGEEGYTESQKQLLCQRRNNNGYQEIFRPAPNKTVFDKDSPPPYCSHSLSSASSVDNLGHSGSLTRPVVGECNGYSMVFQCCSNHTHQSNCLHVHDSSSRTRTMLSSSLPSAMAGARYSRNIIKSSRNSLDRPPDYHSVISACTELNNYQSSSDDGV